MDGKGQPRQQLGEEQLAAGEQSAQSDASRTGPERAEDAPGKERAPMSRSALFDSVGALVMILDLEGRIYWFNRVCEDATGLSFLDVWGKHVWDVMPISEGADIVKDVLESVRRRGVAPAYESRLETRDGSPKIIYWSTAPLLDGEGAVEHVVGVGIDITERQLAEEALRTSEEQYRRLVESSSDAILVHHRGTMVFANRAGAMLLGASDPGEIIGRPVLDFVHPDHREIVETRLEKILKHDTELALIEDKLVRLDGSTVNVDAHSIFPFMYQEKPAIQVVIRELKETRQTQPEALAPHRMFETLLRISSGAVMATDLRGRITHVSQGALELYGFEDADELIGRSTFELVVAEDHEDLIKNLQKTFKEGVVRNIELSLLSRDGSRFSGALDMALNRDGQGRPRGFVATAKDLRQYDSPVSGVSESHREGEEASALLEASRAVLAYRDFERAARAIFDACSNLIGAGAGYVGLINEDASKDNVLFSDPPEFSWTTGLERSRPMREVRAEVYLTGRALYLNESAAGGLGQLRPGRRLTVDNILFAPLAIDQNTLGVLGFANKPGGFSEEDARMASAFGELAAVSLESTRAWEALEVSEERFRSVADTTGDAIVTFDSDEYIVSWNPGAEAIFGYSADEMSGKRLTLVAPGDLREAYKNAVNEVESGGGSSTLAEPVEMIGRRKDGSTFPLELSFAGWKARKGVFLTSTIRDITERKLAEHDLRLLADHDHLTGLPNRALFRDRLTQALADANRNPQHLAVLMIDLDHFRYINHTLGLQAGDQVLQAVGDRLTGLIRTDDSVARSGDDEFILLLVGMEAPGHADTVGQRILEALREPFAVNGHEVRVTASIGAAIYPDHGEDIDTLMKRADVAMCRVKAEGRDSYERFSSTEDRGSEEELRTALAPSRDLAR